MPGHALGVVAQVVATPLRDTLPICVPVAAVTPVIGEVGAVTSRAVLMLSKGPVGSVNRNNRGFGPPGVGHSQHEGDGLTARIVAGQRECERTQVVARAG